MFRVFSFLAVSALSSLVYSQDSDLGSGPAIEINESKEEISKDPFVNEDPEAVGAEIDAFEQSNISEAAEMPQPEAASGDAVESANEIPVDGGTTPTAADEPLAVPAEEETVLVRERVEPTQSSQGNGTPDNLVEVRSSRAIFLPYKERQNPWGFTVSFGGEFLYFPNLVSQYDFATYEDMFGTDTRMAMNLELGPKYNMSWGSLGLTFGYTSLDISDDRMEDAMGNGVEAGLKFTRISTTLAYYLDTIWSEASFIPYIAGGLWQADYEETNDEYPGEKEKYTTEVGYHWRAGGLIGLGWLEPNTALRSRKTVGLQEAFLNLYVSSTYMSESDPEPDLESEYDIGATVLLEF